MKRTINRAGKAAVNILITAGKRALDLSPKTKEKLKGVLLAKIRPGANASLAYDKWLQGNIPDGIDLYNCREELKGLSYKPLISIIVPLYNTPEIFFREMVESVQAQVYENWELILVDDASPDDSVRDLVMEYTQKDSRIKSVLLKKNHHISGATNKGIATSKGEFVSLFDHDDILWPNALFEIVKALNDDKKLNFIYTDEDKIVGDSRREHRDPFLKPDWSPELLRAVNYITHFTTIRKSVLDKVGGEDGNYNGAQDWELFLRVTRSIKPETIHHVPKIVYSWRVHENSTAGSLDSKPYVVEAQRQALEDDAKARGVAATVKINEKTGYWLTQYEMIGRPLVSIVIPSKNQYHILKRCIDSIYEHTTYDNFEIILVDTGSTEENVKKWYKTLKNKPNLHLHSFIEDKFSYANSCNYGAEQAKGELLVMLNNDIEIVTPDWIERLAGYAQQDTVGAVGVKLYYPDRKTIQHAGVGIGVGGCAANLFSGYTVGSPLTLTQSIFFDNVRNISAVTAACLMVRTSVYKEMGGFKSKYRINYNDVDLCLRIQEAGYSNIYVPDIKIIHHESISRGTPKDKKHDNTEFDDAQRMFEKDWGRIMQTDPFLNVNLDKRTQFLDIKTGELNASK